MTHSRTCRVDLCIGCDTAYIPTNIHQRVNVIALIYSYTNICTLQITRMYDKMLLYQRKVNLSVYNGIQF